jgi:LCP family protein required for cell wall assembly
MLDMPMLGLGGKRAGNFYGQLALSHTYGSGLEDSAENTLTAVSDLLYGLQMDYYVTLNMDAIGMLNDAVGGVTVEVTEDFSQVDPTITKGTVTLNRSQAIHYVRSRKDVGAQLNVTRMERQEGYIRGLMEALLEKVNSSSRFALDLYEDMAEYTVTNCSPKVLTSILNTCAQYELGGMSTLPGENVRGERYYEFYPDKEKIFTMVLDLCYEPKE